MHNRDIDTKDKMNKEGIQSFVALFKKYKHNLNPLMNSLIKATNGAITSLNAPEEAVSRSAVDYGENKDADHSHMDTDSVVRNQLQGVRDWLVNMRSQIKGSGAENFERTLKQTIRRFISV
ncbi:MAG: hypothetical protein CME62_05550 [Halobacteriovoraceae bacterium]|nr:hypothetical protein [Halobacteriovoraceae bacterium]|tara:strand:+ start:11106 stop:11468 length:363 start_codon:yes stop_codon:yes gene_type:complete